MAEVKTAAVAVKPVAVKKAAKPKKVLKSSDVVTVENISREPVNLANGSIAAGKKGKATIAELKTLGKYIKQV